MIDDFYEGLHGCMYALERHISGSQRVGRRLHGLARFTLIELLVVVAIIAILASFLLPALTKAREAGRSALCIANLRSVFLGIDMYADTFDDYVPTPAVQASTGSDADWHLKVGESTAWGAPQPYTGANHTTGNAQQQMGYAVLSCPSETGTQSSNSAGVSFFRWYNGRTSYSMNITMTYRVGSYWGSHRPRKGWSNGPDFRTAKTTSGILYRPVTSPSAAGIVMDIDETENRWTAARYSTSMNASSGVDFTETRYAFRHNGKTNRLQWDGHVEALLPYPVSGEVAWQYLFDALPLNNPVTFPTEEQTPWPDF